MIPLYLVIAMLQSIQKLNNLMKKSVGPGLEHLRRLTYDLCSFIADTHRSLLNSPRTRFRLAAVAASEPVAWAVLV